IAGTATLLAIACAIGLHEPQREPGKEAVSPKRDRARPSAMRVPNAVPLAMAAACAYFGVYGLIPVFAEHVREIVPEPNAASLWVGVLHSVMWGATLIGSFWWGKHNDLTQRPLRTFALAAAGCAASIAILSLPLDPFALIPFRLAQGFCFAALAQSLFLHFSKHAPSENKSAFVSTANSYLLIGQSAGPLLAGPMVGALPVAGTVLVMAAMGGLGAILALGPTRAEKYSMDELDDEVTEGQSEPTADETLSLPVITEPVRNGVTIVPYCGWHIAPHRLGTLAARYATPWDQSGEAPPDEAARTFDAWQRSGTLFRDHQPAFYAYEQSGPRGTLRGVLGAVHLDSGLLPHEDVISERIDRIVDLMHEGAMNLDPLLLGYSGEGRTTACLARAARAAPVSEILADDGQLHRVWRISDRSAQDEVIGEMAGRAAFIADGHHRHAAARQLRREYYATGNGPGPWDYIAGLLVDVKRNPMQLAPMHRVLPYTDPQAALKAASTRFRIRPLRGELRQWLPVLKEHARGGPAFVVATPRGAFLLSEPNQALLDASLNNCPPSLRPMHLSVLHNLLIDELWRVPDLPEYVSYDASAINAVRRVQRQGGFAVLLTPPTQKDLRTAAAAGMRLPRKSTSFGPKPHPGLVFRTTGKR
ncbi:MFS transporter, partial [Saccharopolyspora tripterygii]